MSTIVEQLHISYSFYVQKSTIIDVRKFS